MMDFLFLPPSLQAGKGGQFQLGYRWYVELLQWGADGKVLPQSGKALTPPVQPLWEKGIICYCMVSVKEGGM